MDTEITETTVEDAAEATLKKEKRKKYILLTLKVLFLVYFLKYLWKIIVNLCAICWYSLVVCVRIMGHMGTSDFQGADMRAQEEAAKSFRRFGGRKGAFAPLMATIFVDLPTNLFMAVVTLAPTAGILMLCAYAAGGIK